MLPTSDVAKIARARLEDAQVLLRGHRFDGAVYICGYAVELALKTRICRTLKWAEFPEKDSEFKSYHKIFKIHSLGDLLALSGVDAKIKKKYLAEWSLVDTWKPENRYRPAGSVTPADCQAMISAARVLLRFLCRN